MKSRFVSQEACFKLLGYLGDQYIPPDKVDPQLVFDPKRLGDMKNLLVRDTSFDTFCMHVKGALVKYRFWDPVPLMYACKAMDLLVNFYVAQNDGQSANLSETEQFDLLIFALGTHQKNDQLKTVVAEVVKVRMRVKKPTWIFLPYPTLDQCKQEASPDLTEMLASYTGISIAGGNQVKQKLSQVKKQAANFSIG